MKASIVFLAVAAVLVGSVSAQTCPSSGVISYLNDPLANYLNNTNWDRTLSVPQFDQATCGTLLSAALTYFGSVVGTLAYESTEANPTQVTLSLSASIQMRQGWDGLLLLNVTPVARVATTAGPADGVLDFGGSSGGTFANLEAPANESKTVTNPADLVPYIGTGRVFFPTVARAFSDQTGSGNLIQQKITRARARVTVVYRFRPILPPPPPEVSIRSDPHFVAGNGLKFDFMGAPGSIYTVYTDRRLHMNMHMIGVRGNSERKGTWMDEISIMFFPYYNITVSATSPPGTPYTAAHGTVTVNGKTMKSQKLSTMTRWHGLTIQRRKTRVFITIQNLLKLELEVVRAAFWESEDGPGNNYLNLKISALNATQAVHGVMGQTFRETFDVTELPVKGKDGEGVIEGKAEDYIVSGMFAADCKLCTVFDGRNGWNSKVAEEDATKEISEEMHSWTGMAGADSESDEDDLAWE